MSMNGKGLGRGLDALFQDNSTHADPQAPDNATGLMTVSPQSLSPNPGQPREDFNEEKLKELADSIKEKGILQPLLVRPTNQPGSYQIIAGERRWRAAQIAGLSEIPVLIRDFDDSEAMIAALIENIQREDLNPIEQAKALAALQKILGVSQDGLAEKLGKQRGTISNLMRIIRLSPEGQADLIHGRITIGHARAIVGLPADGPAEGLRKQILDKGLSVRETEEAAAFWRDNNRFPWESDAEDHEGKPRLKKDPAIRTLAQQIGATLNCQTRISGTADRGKISLAYESNAQLYELLEKLGLSLSSLTS